jgi:GAF domain-containing protein
MTPDTPLAATAAAATQAVGDPDEALDAILSALQQVVQCQTVLISDIDTDRGDLRIHAVHNTDPGLDVPQGLTIPLTASPCQHVASEIAPFNASDMHADPGLAMLPAAKDMGATTYFGVPVLLPDGSFFGSLVALDVASKPHTPEITEWMQILARLAGGQVQRQLSRVA